MVWFNRKITNNSGLKSLDLNNICYDSLPILCATELVDLLLLKKRILNISRLVGLSQEHYRPLYLATINNVIEAMQLVPASAAHHHAGPGGLAVHTLEVVEYSLTIRNERELPIKASPNERFEQRHCWTFAVFVAAILHDIGKLICSYSFRLNDGTLWNPHGSPLKHSTASHYQLTFRTAKYKHHQFVANSFMHLIPELGRGWLAQNPDILVELSSWLYGDHYEFGEIAKIVRSAEQMSVGTNLKRGGGSLRFPQANQVPLVERLMTGLRELLADGSLVINRSDGSSGWVDKDYTYLVCGTIADKLRVYLNEVGDSSIPADNTRIFDIFQQSNYLHVTAKGHAVWYLTINNILTLTVLKFDTHRLFHPSTRPSIFGGELVITETAPAVVKNNTPAPVVISEQSAPDLSVAEAAVISSESEQPLHSMTVDSAPVVYSKATTETDVTNEAPAQSNIETDVLNDTEKLKAFEISNSVVPDRFLLSDHEIGNYFLAWLRAGLRDGGISVNRPQAIIHITQDGVLIVSPLAFKQFARYYNFLLDEENNEDDVTRRIQARLERIMLKQKLHRKARGGKNIHIYVVKGPKRSSKIVGWLVPASVLYGTKKPPEVNAHLTNSSGFMVEQ